MASKTTTPTTQPHITVADDDGGDSSDIEARYVALPRTASSENSIPSTGLVRSGSLTSRVAASSGGPNTGVTFGHTPRSPSAQAMTFGLPSAGGAASQGGYSSSGASTPLPTGSTHAGGIQPSASFFHPARPNHYIPAFNNLNFNHASSTPSNYPPPIGGPSPMPSSSNDHRPSSTGSDSFARTSFTTEEFGGASSAGRQTGGAATTGVTSNPSTLAHSFSTKISREPLLPIGERPKPKQLLRPSVSGRGRSNTSPLGKKSSGSGSGSGGSEGSTGGPGGRVRTSLEKFIRRTLSVDAHSPSTNFMRSAKDLASVEDLEARGHEANDSYVELEGGAVMSDGEIMYNITNDKPLNHSTSLSRRAAQLQARGRFPNYTTSPPISEKGSNAPPLARTPVLSSSGKPVRKYEMHPSQNKFFVRGKALTGGDSALPFIASLTLALGLAGTWSGTTAVWWWHNESPAVAIVGAYISLLMISNMLATAFSDPGILPRDLDLDPPYPNTTPSDDGTRAPLPRDLKIRNGVVRVKFCQTCRIYRPPRSSHCRMCDNCVDGCDHHCQWVNNCVGRRNYTSFIIMLTTATLCLCLFICTSALHLVIQAHQDNISAGRSLRKGAGSAVVFAISIVVLWPVAGLLGYHVRLLFLNLTTIEQIRTSAHKSLVRGPAPPNPFALGTWRRNMAEMLCRPRGLSWLDASSVATEDKRIPNPGAPYDPQSEAARAKEDR